MQLDKEYRLKKKPEKVRGICKLPFSWVQSKSLMITDWVCFCQHEVYDLMSKLTVETITPARQTAKQFGVHLVREEQRELGSNR